ncbi:MAG: type II toxin-antitoxin system ParD family antitoxin [Cyanobacteria bacterium P01_C01_bin.118]
MTDATLPVSQLIQTKLEAGKYRSAEEVLAVALQLLDEYERSESEWVENVRAKIDAAIEASENTAPVDGETFVNGILGCRFNVPFENDAQWAIL